MKHSFWPEYFANNESEINRIALRALSIKFRSPTFTESAVAKVSLSVEILTLCNVSCYSRVEVVLTLVCFSVSKGDHKVVTSHGHN